MPKDYDFSGWATRNDILCTDGRTIRRDAFKDNDGKTVPLVWNHQHNDPENVLGHALLENREDGVYAYCKFNDTSAGKSAKELVRHGDVRALSIFANRLKQNGGNVIHGDIKELSLVLAGANSGAFIDSVMIHGEESDDSLIIGYDENALIIHADDNDGSDENGEGAESAAGDSGKKEKTVAEIYNAMTEEQKNVVNYLVGKAIDDDASNTEEDDEEMEHGDDEMKHNVFENEETNDQNTLSHSEMQTIISDAKRYGSMKDSFLAHAEEYGIENLEYLFPEARNLNNPPEFIKRDTGWVSKVMSGVHKSPFSRIKSTFADITEDDARAKGYLKGKLKKEEVFGLLKRTTTPTTVYKKQKMDRDDVIDITDFDVISWLKSEMRMMLDEELARAFLIGDGRSVASEDKINEQNIRPIAMEEELFTVQKTVDVAKDANEDAIAKAFIRAVIKSRKEYKGSGNPTLFTTEDMVTNCLLLTDEMGRDLYDSVEKLATKLRVKEIVTVEVMENVNGKNGKPLMAVLVNLNDYNVGADKGGAVNMFDDFDIDYNQQKYLIETRCSGALVKPYSAIAYTLNKAQA